jgi:hypothetical protein
VRATESVICFDRNTHCKNKIPRSMFAGSCHASPIHRQNLSDCSMIEMFDEMRAHGAAGFAGGSEDG